MQAWKKYDFQQKVLFLLRTVYHLLIHTAYTSSRPAGFRYRRCKNLCREFEIVGARKKAVNAGRLLFLYRKFLLNHELCKQIALQKQGTENRRLRLEDIKTFFSKIVIVDIIKFM